MSPAAPEPPAAHSLPPSPPPRAAEPSFELPAWGRAYLASHPLAPLPRETRP